ncbi:MAG: ECF-type sigma factor [Planctomycetota bacterium]|nr:ECF-type sigma factor [Planctomycetota bacterium]
MPLDPKSETRTLLLNDAEDSARRAELLLPLVYAELRATAQACLARERGGHTLQATALVHGAYLKLVGPRELPWQNRPHFYAAAAEALRRILVDHARSKAPAKRGGRARQSFGEAVAVLRRLPGGRVSLCDALWRSGRARWNERTRCERCRNWKRRWLSPRRS